MKKIYIIYSEFYYVSCSMVFWGFFWCVCGLAIKNVYLFNNTFLFIFCQYTADIYLHCIFNKDTICFICIDSTLHVGMIKTIVCFDEKYENDTLVRIIFTSIWAVLVLMSFACWVNLLWVTVITKLNCQ